MRNAEFGALNMWSVNYPIFMCLQKYGVLTIQFSYVCTEFLFVLHELTSSECKLLLRIIV